MEVDVEKSNSLFVTNLRSATLEKIVRTKLEDLFLQQREEGVELQGLYEIILEQVEKPLIEMTLRQYNGNQVRAAIALGINRNTLKKKIDRYKIIPKLKHRAN